jgi:hypothetical protein
MTIWTGIGINYGHQSLYDASQVEADFTFLKAQGITRLRIAMPTFDSTSGAIANGQDMVQRALNHGFYTVWGVVVGYGPGTITASRWAAGKAYILNTLVPWAQSNGLSELCLTNESELSADNTTITAAQIRADIRSMASTIKAGGFSGKVSYSTSILQTYRTPWITEGIGVLDLIGFNSYDVLTNFNARNSAIVFAFGDRTYVSEFGSNGGGYPDFNNEQAFYNDTSARIMSIQNAGIASGYSFCYRDGSYGVPPNTFGLVKTDGTVHLARNAVFGM